MLQQLNAITDPTFRERLDRLIIKGALKAKLFVGVGLAEELHKPFRKPPHLLKVKVFAKDDIWSADLVEMPHENQGRSGTFKYIYKLISIYTLFMLGNLIRKKKDIQNI